MIIPDQVLQEIAKGDIAILHSHLMILKAEEDIDEVWDKIKNGVDIKFDLNSVLKGHITIKEKSGLVMVDGEWIGLKEYWDEMDAREALARATLYKYINLEEPVEPR